MKTFWRILTIISIALWIGSAVWILMQYDRTYKRVGLHRTEIYKMWNIEHDDYYSQSIANELIDCCKDAKDTRMIADYLNTGLYGEAYFLKDIIQEVDISIQKGIRNIIIEHSEKWWDSHYEEWDNALKNGDRLGIIIVHIDTDSDSRLKLHAVSKMFKETSFQTKWQERIEICKKINKMTE